MKNASQIITSIQNKPQFSKLSKYKCIKRIESIFIPALQKMIKFSYIKNDTLFFVLSHPAGKQEFDNNIQNIKSALKFHMPHECSDRVINDIKAFVTHTPVKKAVTAQKQDVTYAERATGDFTVNIHDEKLNSLVKSIQTIIKIKNATIKDKNDS
ncbi:MAG: hypothetical protein AUK54_01885 [Helicobacteraceae bacterium CG2_30_36_10]|nr:MAG: hypothetical protein AUK54_01885 [Helicobacteraceae bacterium CG2_30_36_10]